MFDYEPKPREPWDESDWGNAIYIVLLVAALAVSFWWWNAQYDECRALGFSSFYCWQHAG